MVNVANLRSALSYDPDAGLFAWNSARGSVRAGQRAGVKKALGYREIQFEGRAYMEHVLAWVYVHGEMPAPGLQVDHINLVKDDNRIANLRLATRSQQQANTRLQSNNKTGVKGMKWREDKKCWRVEIYVNGKAHHVGHFRDKEAARTAYAAAQKKHYGEFARAA